MTWNTPVFDSALWGLTQFIDTAPPVSATVRPVPRKPYKSFPLTPRADGRFQKMIRGQLHYFGRDGDWREALDQYLKVARQLHAGQPRRQEAPTGVTVLWMVEKYLSVRKEDADAGLISIGSWDDYRDALARFGTCVGKDLPAHELHPDHFAEFAKTLTTLSPYTANRIRALIRAWLKYSAAAGWVQSVNYGVQFKRIPAAKIRAAKRMKNVTADQVEQWLAAAKLQMRAMIYLGLNGAFGATDCATLERRDVDLTNAIIRTIRRKTNTPRLVTLWPETVTAIQEVMTKRPDDTLVFRTKYGRPWVQASTNKEGNVIQQDSIGSAFIKLAGAGIGFYSLRHTFASIASEIPDVEARRRIMGHRLRGMDEVYVDHLSIARLKVVTDHVRSRILKPGPVGLDYQI